MTHTFTRSKPLSVREKEALFYLYFDTELTQQELADIWGISNKTVSKAIRFIAESQPEIALSRGYYIRPQYTPKVLAA